MVWWLYNLLFPIAFLFLLPHYLLRMCRRGGYARDFLQRFGRYRPEVDALLAAPGPVLWIQAVSVGELGIALTFIDALRARVPGLRVVLSTNTSTGYALAQKKVRAPDVAVYFPLDVPWVMRRVFRKIRPDVLALVENEMWPNLIRTAARLGVPVAMVNGRISEHSFKGYRKLRFLTRRVLPLFGVFCTQSRGDADRLAALGAPEDRLVVAGSAKYDISATSAEAVERMRALVRALRPGGGAVVVGGSTWPGEEEVLLDWYRRAKPANPDLLLVLVPRHAERREEVLAAIKERGLGVVQRSRPDDPAPENPDVLLVDTTGELRPFYALADIVFVGKSLTQTGGQNPIEPAKDGRPVLVGPHMENFPAVSVDFAEAGAWRQVADAAALGEALDDWLAHPEAARECGRRAAELVASRAGATALMAERVAALFKSRS